MTLPVDDRDHEALGASEDDEYELEAPDPDVLAAKERHSKDVVATAESKIDVDDLYREDEERRRAELVADVFSDIPSRFQIKHLLWGTAALAVALTLFKFAGAFGGLFLIGMVGIATSLVILHLKERKQEAEFVERRRKFYERQKEIRAQQGLEKDTTDDKSALSTSDIDIAWQEAMTKQPSFELTFSLRQMLIAVTGAAVLFGMISVLGAETLAVALGTIAVAGLLLHALGVEAPSTFILGWWFLLIMYVLMSIVAIVREQLFG